MKYEKLSKLIAKGRVAAIVKDVAGRRMLFGFERPNKRSRKYHRKYLSQPIDLAQLTKGAQQKISETPNEPNSPTNP